ncbi:MAG: phosphoenolpyruvate--protein phosphotransferase, partial [Vicinamibacteria bacterium]|nr:phosphoenolpyruvate--protein phosphotransferase [Vicinamibacteria bacterium]
TDVRAGDRCLLVFEGPARGAAHEAVTGFIRQRLAHCDDSLSAAAARAPYADVPRALQALGTSIRRGIPVVSGIGRGRLVCVAKFSLPAGLSLSGASDSAQERQRIERGLAELASYYDARLIQTAGRTATEIVRVHRSIACDPEFHGLLFSAVRDRACTAAGAVVAAEKRLSAMLSSSGNALLRERAFDIQDVCQQLLRQIYGAAIDPRPLVLERDSIVAAESLTPDRLMAFDRRHLKGLVFARAGRASHTIILAASFGIPVLVGVADLIDARLDGEDAILDAVFGGLLTHLSAAARRYYALEERRLAERGAYLRHRATERSRRVRDRVKLRVAANIASADEVEGALAAGAEGVGLFRTELLYMCREQPPSEDQQYEEYRRALAAAQGHAVIIRTLDIGGDKAIAYLPLPHEKNPFLGIRGMRAYPSIEPHFRAQIRALLRAARHGDLKVLIPMVSDVEQVLWVKKVCAQEAAALRKRGVPHGSPPLGVMIEVPAAVFLIDALSRVVDFFSIGSNDLLQYFAAADRSNQDVADLYQPYLPAFLGLLKQAVDRARARRRWIELCGEVGSRADFLPLLAGLKLDAVSMSAPSIPKILALLGRLSAKGCARLLADACNCRNASDVARLAARKKVMQVLPLLDDDLVIVNSDAMTKDEALKAVCDRLHVVGRTEQPQEIEAALWRLEDVCSTGFGHGFAIPHCKSSALCSSSLVMLKLAAPIDWGAADGRPVDVVMFLGFAETDSARTHMRLLSRLARQLMQAAFRSRLAAENDPRALARFLTRTLTRA